MAKSKVILLNITRNAASGKRKHFHEFRKEIDPGRRLLDEAFLGRIVLSDDMRVSESCWNLRRILRANIVGLARRENIRITIKLG